MLSEMATAHKNVIYSNKYSVWHVTGLYSVYAAQRTADCTTDGYLTDVTIATTVHVNTVHLHTVRIDHALDQVRLHIRVAICEPRYLDNFKWQNELTVKLEET